MLVGCSLGDLSLARSGSDKAVARFEQSANKICVYRIFV